MSDDYKTRVARELNERASWTPPSEYGLPPVPIEPHSDPCNGCAGYGVDPNPGFYDRDTGAAEPPSMDRCERCLGTGMREVAQLLSRAEDAEREVAQLKRDIARSRGYEIIESEISTSYTINGQDMGRAEPFAGAYRGSEVTACVTHRPTGLVTTGRGASQLSAKAAAVGELGRVVARRARES
jgi:hypothetical protein